MADRWLYIHAGAAHGPVDLEKLAQLAALGKLLPTDPVWPAGEDRRRAVEAHTLVKIESSPPSKVEEARASPPPSARATPDWLFDVEPAAAPAISPDVELVIETSKVDVGNEIVDLDAAKEIVDVDAGNKKSAPKVATPAPPPKPPKDSKPATSAAPELPVAEKRKAAAPSSHRPDRKEADEPDEAGFDFKRRDLVMFGLGVIGVGLAVAAGLCFANYSSKRTTDEDPPE